MGEGEVGALEVVAVALGTLLAVALWIATVGWQRAARAEQELQRRQERRDGFARAIRHLIHGD